jgi:hypothetical protein
MMNIETETCNLIFVLNTISLLYIVRANDDWSHMTRKACLPLLLHDVN